MLALIIAAAEEAAHGGAHESDKTLFYVLGGAAAVWAVILSAIGLAKPGFPGRGAYPVIIAITVLLVVGAMASTVITA